MIIDNDNNNDNKNQARHMDATVYMCARNKLGFCTEYFWDSAGHHFFPTDTEWNIAHLFFV